MPKKKPRDVPREVKTLPKRIKFARERADIPQSAVAEAMQVHPSQITRWEKAETGEGIELATVIRLAQALHCDFTWLATDEGDPGPVPVLTEKRDKRRRKPDGD